MLKQITYIYTSIGNLSGKYQHFPVGTVTDWQNDRFCLIAADRSSNFYVNLKENILGVGDEAIYKWAVKPPASPSNDDMCVRQGTLMVRPPACITEIRVLMEFSDPTGYTFHSSHLVFADGWAGFDGSGMWRHHMYSHRSRHRHSYGKSHPAFANHRDISMYIMSPSYSITGYQQCIYILRDKDMQSNTII